MKTYDEHLRDCRSLRQSRPAKSVPTLDASGLVLATAVHARLPFPAFVASAMDGYAVRASDVPGRLEVIGDIPAGRQPEVTVRPGTAVRIMTGSVVPAGADAVVPVEQTHLEGDRIAVEVATAVGRHIRGIGEDVKPGDLVLDAEQVIGPTQLAALVAHNVTTVDVSPRPRVAVLSTGDELVELGRRPAAAQLINSNGPGLAAAAEAAGAEVVHQAIVGDDPEVFAAVIGALPEVELIVTSGGVSMGAYDVVKAVLASRGITFDNVAMQPGRPQGWGRLDNEVPFLGLPGNPVSALLSFELFGRAALGRERPVSLATLADPVERSPVGKRQFLRGRLGDGTVHLVSGPESHLIVGLARADCLIVIEEEVETVSPGSVVKVITLGG